MNENKNKKILLIIACISFAAAVIIVGIMGLREGFIGRANISGLYRNNHTQGRIARKGIAYPLPTPIEDKNQFILPLDAAKSGELAITVDNIDAAKKNVADIAARNEGSVYSSFIAYASNDIKNGSIVVQVPVEKFDIVFDMLRSVGQKVVQESTQQIEKRTIYPMIQSSTTNANGVSQETSSTQTEKNELKKEEANSATNEGVEKSATSPEIAIYPNPNQAQEKQDKGYIRIVFADFDSSKNIGTANSSNSGSVTYSPNVGENMQKIFLIGLVLKILLLITLISLLIFIFRKIIHSFRRHNSQSQIRHQTRPSEKKSVVHVVRQAPRSKIITIRKK